MKKQTLLFSLAFLCCLFSLADTSTTVVNIGSTTQMSLSELIGKGLPVVYIETVDGVKPTCDTVYAPPGCWGETVNSEKVPGRLVIYDRVAGMDSMLYDSGDYEKNVGGMTIKVRGNTSAATDEKKPYKIKLQKKADLLLRGVDSVYKDKEWLLLKDPFVFTNTAFRISEMVGMMWVPGHRYVNVVINDDYHGIYLLTEAVKRNPDCRLNVDKNCGYIFECDLYWWNESVYVRSNEPPSYNYTFKYPEDEDITQEQLDYAQTMVRAYEASLTQDNYPDLIDVRSFAAWCLVHDIVGTKDGGGCNRFYSKYDTTAQSKIFMPVAWDFDLAERTTGAWSRIHEVYMKKLFNNPNRAFVHEYIRLWCQMRDTCLSDVHSYYMNFVNSPLGRALQDCYHLDNKVWDTNRWFQNAATDRLMWLQRRYSWLDSNIMSFHVPNDVNIDGVVNISDVTELIKMVMGSTRSLITGDINGDEEVNISDVTSLTNLLLNSIND